MNNKREERLLQPEVDYTLILMNAVSDIEDYQEDMGIESTANPCNLEHGLPRRRKLLETREEFAKRILIAIENFNEDEYVKHLEDKYKVRLLDAQAFADNLEAQLKGMANQIKSILKEDD